MERRAFLITSLTVASLVAALAGCNLEEQQRIARSQQNVRNAMKLREEGLSDEALASFNAALKENPKLVEAHMGVGDIYRQRGDYENASAAYEHAAVLAPTSFNAHYYLGLTRQLLGKIPEAVDAYLRAAAIKPDDPDANANLASAYLQLNRPADGLPYAKRAAELKPADQAAWANLAATHSLLGQYDDAVDAYRRAAALGDLDAPILLGLADAHIKLAHYDRANAVLQTMIRKTPTATAYERLGYSQFKQRHYDDAMASFRAALSIDSKDIASLNGLGVCQMTLYIQSGRQAPEQRDQAIDAWRKSLLIRPEQPKIIDLMSRYMKM